MARYYQGQRSCSWQTVVIAELAASHRSTPLPVQIPYVRILNPRCAASSAALPCERSQRDGCIGLALVSRVMSIES